MSKATRGRPKLNNNVIKIEELVVEYLSTKSNNYNNEISYFLKLLTNLFVLN